MQHVLIKRLLILLLAGVLLSNFTSCNPKPLTGDGTSLALEASMMGEARVQVEDLIDQGISIPDHIVNLEEAAVPSTNIMVANAPVPNEESDKTLKPSVLPQKVETITGKTVYSNEKATVDASNLSEGYVMVRYTGSKRVQIKVQITKENGAVYTYNLNSMGNYESFPLSEGDGSYNIKVFENISGTKYAQAYDCTLNMTLRNDFLPFLYPNQYVNYNANSAVVTKTVELVANSQNDLESLEIIYRFVINHLTYDKQLAATVTSDYLPDVDKVLAAGKGICFDYAALMSAMLRSQNIPSKLVVGYAQTEYHAWINVYIENIGWIDKAIYFDGVNWSFMDPTFVSSARHAGNLSYSPDQKNYSVKYVY